MNRVAILGALGVTVAVGIGIVVSVGGVSPVDLDGGVEMAGPVNPGAPVVALSEVDIMASKLGILEDGGLVSYIDGALPDGGDVVLSSYPCVRRPANSVLPTDCMRQTPGDIPRNFGVLNRFPAIYAIGLACEPVPCSVWAGDAP